MPDTKRKPKSRHAGEIADLFRVLRNMSRDERVSEADFRIAFRISQAVNADTGWAEIGDAALMDELPRTRDKGKLRLFRHSMTELGWLRIVEGVRGRATLYLFLEDNSAAIEERSEQAKARRESEFNLRRIKRKTGLQVAALGVNIDPSTGEIRDELRGESTTLNGTTPSELRGESIVDKGCISTPLLPQRSTSSDPLSVKDETHRVLSPPPLLCTDCLAPAVIRDRVGGTLYCQECADEFPPNVPELIHALDDDDDGDLPPPLSSYAAASRGS